MKYSRFVPAIAAAVIATLLILLAAPALRAQSRRGRNVPDCPCARPYAAAAHMGDTVYWLDTAPFAIPCTVGPIEAVKEAGGGARLRPIDPNRNRYELLIPVPQEGTTRIVLKASNCGMVQMDEFFLSVEKPMLRPMPFDENNLMRMISSAIDQWEGLHAVVGEFYDPSSAWANIAIPENHYQTVVRIKGQEVMNSAGTTFHNLGGSARERMTITEDITAEDIVTRVYWKPGGTPEMTRWVLLLSNHPDPKAVIRLDRTRMEVELARPKPRE